ncbi:hypothetical protein PINS_up003720 [Pythium insidiosum]|nr:hypothetical protein PINS_up003720 [Pythium insidiosum]
MKLVSLGAALLYSAPLVAVHVPQCDAGSKVQIRVVHRPKPEPSHEEIAGPIPFRAPLDPTGPFSSYVDAVGCLKDTRFDLDTQSVVLDICHLKNVTFIDVTEGNTEDQGDADESASSSASEDGQGQTDTPQPGAMRKILGMFRGWKIDPISKHFKYAIFDDGDVCDDSGRRHSISVELVPSNDPNISPHVYDYRQVSQCDHAVRVELYVPTYELTANSIHSAGILDLSDPEESLPQVCAEVKCDFSRIAAKVDYVIGEVQGVKNSLDQLIQEEKSSSVSSMTLTSASSIIKSSTEMMERALELLQFVEELHELKKQQSQVITDTASAETQTEDEVAVS